MLLNHVMSIISYGAHIPYVVLLNSQKAVINSIPLSSSDAILHLSIGYGGVTRMIRRRVEQCGARRIVVEVCLIWNTYAEDAYVDKAASN